MVPVSVPHRNEPAFPGADRPGAPPSRPQKERGNFGAEHGKIRSRRILVVDDELLIRWSLNEGLARVGFEVLEAEDARGALARFGPDAPHIDAVVLDLRLPDSADLGLLRRIRELSPETPVIMMTAYGSLETTEDALRLGAWAVVSKPFDLHRMVTMVEDAVAEP
ncbi:MAG TPA: response regulator [Vicinamibacterales bacterium]|nr:response regulator [Vicinamibacterales bacterium]